MAIDGSSNHDETPGAEELHGVGHDDEDPATLAGTLLQPSPEFPIQSAHWISDVASRVNAQRLRRFTTLDDPKGRDSSAAVLGARPDRLEVYETASQVCRVQRLLGSLRPERWQVCNPRRRALARDLSLPIRHRIRLPRR